MDVTEDKSFYRTKYNLPQDSFVVMVAAGGYGRSGMKRVIKALMKVKQPITLVAICGTNKSLYDKLQILKENTPANIDLRPYEFVNAVYELNRAADMFLTKGGPSAMLDSVLMGVPVGVFYCASHIEKMSTFLFTYILNCGRFLPRANQIVEWVNSCAGDPTILDFFIRNTESIRKAGNGAEDIAKFIQTYDA
jgi:UDP-N-acetylglucosamine:LPS N-acetylglucosamine transferase